MPRPLSAKARQKAIDAAKALLAEQGIDGFSVDEVARRSGVAKTTIYRHWASANELLMEGLHCHVEQVPTPDTGSLHSDLSTMLDALRPIVLADGTRQLMLDMLAASARDPELEEIKRGMLVERTHPIPTILQRAIDRGEIPATDLELASLFIQGPFMARALFQGHPIEPHEIPEMVTLMVRALGGTTPGG